jgi:hypothetical protein
MDLAAEVKQKNKQLLLQRAVLQQQLEIKAATPDINSFLLTFIAAPFLVGVVSGVAAGLFVSPKDVFKTSLWRILLPNLRI